MMTFSAALDFLNQRTMFGIKLGLENIYYFLRVLGNPEKKLRFIHIAGTNGKGSTSALLSFALEENNLKIGLFSSPHLVSVRERVKINNENCSEADFAWAMSEIAKHCSEEHNPTYFECNTLSAILIFVKNSCDFVVWETGMGGKLDATNCVLPIACAITNVALDHTQYLGETIEKIAYEKGGIIKEKTPIFYGGEDEHVRNILQNIAREKSAPFIFRGHDFYVKNYQFTSEGMITEIGFQIGKIIKIETQLWGIHQTANVALATAILKYLSLKVPEINFENSVNVMKNATWPARLQKIKINGEDILIDGAHNFHAAKALVKSIQQKFSQQKFHIYIGILKDKDVKDFLLEINKIAEDFTVLQVKSERATTLENLKDIFLELQINKNITSLDMDDFVLHPPPKNSLFTGSLYLIGELYEKLKN